MATKKKPQFNDIVINEDIVPPQNLETLLKFLTDNLQITGRINVIQTKTGMDVNLLLKAVDPEEKEVTTSVFLGKY